MTPAGTTVVEAAAFAATDSGGWRSSGGADITADILSATIIGGTMEYWLEYIPISSTAAVALGAELTELS